MAAHDWNYWKRITNYKGKLPPTLQEFKKYKIMNKYTPLDINDINRWFKKHIDAVLVTDKINDPIDFSSKFVDKKRLMMELFTWEAVQKGLKAGIKSAMPTGELIERFDGNAVLYLRKLGVKNIALSREMINSHRWLLKQLALSGIHMYAFYINNVDKNKDEKYVVCEENDIFYGIYADKWNFYEDLHCKQ